MVGFVKGFMDSLTYTSFGEAQHVLSKVGVKVVHPKPSQVLVKTMAVSLNPADAKIVQGNFGCLLGKNTPGFDFAGIVVETGSACKRLKPGDYVYGMANLFSLGCLAEYVCVEERVASIKTPSKSFVQAATLGLVVTTSAQLLGRVYDKRVLVLGGSTCTGMAALQITKREQAKVVVATCSPKNAKLVTSLGADLVVDYHQDFWCELGEFDFIYDCVGGKDTWLHADQHLAKHGTFFTLCGDDQDKLTACSLGARCSNLVIRNFFQPGRYVAPFVVESDFRVLDTLDYIDILIDSVFDFDNYKAAFARLGKSAGKVVICMPALRSKTSLLGCLDARPPSFD